MEHLANLVDGPARKTVAVGPQALQVFGKSNLKSQDFQFQVGFIQQWGSFSAVFGSNQRFQQIVKCPFQPLSQNKTMLSRKPTRVVATPQNQVVGFGDDDQFFGFLHRGLRCSLNGRPKMMTAKMTGGGFPISTAFGGKM